LIKVAIRTHIVRLVLLDGRGGALTLPEKGRGRVNTEIASANDLITDVSQRFTFRAW
jgi:hypothetical protein